MSDPIACGLLAGIFAVLLTIAGRLDKLLKASAALSKREEAERKPCTCSDETIARVNAGDICGMGGCPYGGDL